MPRKIGEKKKQSPAKKILDKENAAPAPKRIRDYLSTKFTRTLVAHMHKAKKAALLTNAVEEFIDAIKEAAPSKARNLVRRKKATNEPARALDRRGA